MSYETLTSQTVFQGRAFEVRRDRVKYPDGRVVDLEIVGHRHAVTLVPVSQDGQIWFVEQYRHPAGKMLIELPAGVMEAGETPEQSARREIQEEIGMAPTSLARIGGAYLAPGYSTEYMHFFLATGLYPSALAKDENELLHARRISIREAYQMLENGEIQDAKSVTALFLARPSLG